jgi:hypothetical protein
MAAAVLAALALWAAFRGPSAPAPAGAPIPVATPEQAAPPTEQASASGRRAAPLPTLLVVDEAERAVAAAAIWRYAERDDGTATTDGEPWAEADPEGRIAWRGLGDPEQRVLVRAEGYVPAVVQCGPGPEHVIHLRASPRVTVQVIRDVGAPLAEARVVLSAQVLSTVVGLPGSGVGAPLHPRPVWSGVTDQSGVVEFAELPPGRYYLKAFHPLYCPIASLDDSRPVVISDDLDVTLTLQDMYGLVFECPSPAPVESQAWLWSINELDMSYGVQSRLATCRRALQTRFPGRFVFVHRPRNPTLGTEIGCRVVLSDGTAWHGRWPLRPLRELLEPVFLEQDDVPMRQLEVELVTVSGRVLDVPVLIAPRQEEYRERPPTVTAMPGQPLFLAHGHYVVEPVSTATWWNVAVSELGFEVSASEPPGEVVRLQVDVEFVPVQFEPVLPGPVPLGKLMIKIDDPDRQGLMIANWEPSDGPIRLLVPAGPIDVLVRCAHYEDLQQTFRIEPEDSGRRIELPLVERQR